MASWIQGDVAVKIDQDGRIEAYVLEMQEMNTPRPRNFTESGADIETAQAIRERIPGTYRTNGFLGGATAVVVEMEAMALLPTQPIDLMAKLRQKYLGDPNIPFGNLMYLAMIRSTRGNAHWNGAEPAGGMAEDKNLAAEKLGETAELGIYNDEGWVGFQLPAELEDHQERMEIEQRAWWQVVRPGLNPVAYAPLEFLPYGQDSLNCRPGIVTMGPVGDLAHTSVAQLHLPGKDWRVIDCECRPGNAALGEPAWVPLERTCVGIVQRRDRSPLMLHFGADGRLSESGIHVCLSGEAWEHNVSILSRPVIEALGWVPELGALGYASRS